MKKYLFFFVSILASFNSYAQKAGSDAVLVRQDTITLKASECNWIIKTLPKNVATSESGNSIPVLLLQAIEQGKLKAFDSWTNKPISAKEIYTWKMPIDTIDVSNGGNPKYDVVRHKRTADAIKNIRVCQSWYFDVKSNKLFSLINWIELIEPYLYEAIKNENEDAGQIIFCKIYY